MRKILVLVLGLMFCQLTFGKPAKPDWINVSNMTEVFAAASSRGGNIGFPITPHNSGSLEFEQIFSNCVGQNPCIIDFGLWGEKQQQLLIIGKIKISLDVKNYSITILSAESLKPLTYHFNVLSSNSIKISTAK
jgi:hypothetical protein